MSAEHESAYPRLKSDLTDAELSEIYTPTADELAFARHYSKNSIERLAILLHLKTIQRVGYFVKLTDIPIIIRSHIAKQSQIRGVSKSQLLHLSKTGVRHRLRDLIRKRLNIKAFEKGGAEVVVQATSDAAKTMQELVDIINVAIEELICQRFELPGFSRLLRTARSARNHVNTYIYQTISNSLNTETKKRFNQLLTIDVELAESGWNRLKREPRKPTNKEVRTCIEHLKWLKSWVELLPDVTFIPSAKWRQFVLEAQAVDIGDLKRMKPLK